MGVARDELKTPASNRPRRRSGGALHGQFPGHGIHIHAGAKLIRVSKAEGKMDHLVGRDGTGQFQAEALQLALLETRNSQTKLLGAEFAAGELARHVLQFSRDFPANIVVANRHQ